jgi:hypothetical protein
MDFIYVFLVPLQLNQMWLLHFTWCNSSISVFILEVLSLNFRLQAILMRIVSFLISLFKCTPSIWPCQHLYLLTIHEQLQSHLSWHNTFNWNSVFLFLWGASCCVTLSHFPNIPAITTETLVTISQSNHNMFRPLQAIFRWNTISLTLFEVLSMLQWIRCSLIVTYWCESSNI